MSGPVRKRRAMVVDDDPVVLEVTREHLESVGFEVTTRESSLGTSAAVMREKPDILLLDVHIPGLAGDSLAKLLGGWHDRVAVILYSSDDKDRLADLARECGAIGVIQKTPSREVFLARLDACVAAQAATVIRGASR
jgi:DNA-binding response OmpR family regulator